MISCELALKLKNAGFPQRTIITHVGQEIGMSEPDGSGYVIIPTLEELIEACGDRIFNISSCAEYGKIVSWVANCGNIEGRGLTPSEAVALLWISLNQKNA